MQVHALRERNCPIIQPLNLAIDWKKDFSKTGRCELFTQSAAYFVRPSASSSDCRLGGACVPSPRPPPALQVSASLVRAGDSIRDEPRLGPVAVIHAAHLHASRRRAGIVRDDFTEHAPGGLERSALPIFARCEIFTCGLDCPSCRLRTLNGGCAGPCANLPRLVI